MTRVIPKRPSMALDYGQRLKRKMQRPDVVSYDTRREDLIRLTYFRQRMENLGRLIGILLHWLFVKPVQFIIGFMGLCAFILMRPLLLTSILTMAGVTYLLYWVGRIILSVHGG